MLIRLWLVIIPFRNCYAYKSSYIVSSRFVLHSITNLNDEQHNIYQGKTVAQLKELLRLRGLPVSGLKKELISRLSILPLPTTGIATNNTSSSSSSSSLNHRAPVTPLTVTTTSRTTSVSSPTTTSSTSTTSVSPTTKPYLLQFDGGSRGNPGHAGSGSVILDGMTGREVWHSYTYVGPKCTNNVAEYRGLIEGLRQAVAMHLPHVLIQGDSQLVLKQVEGTYKVNHPDMKVLHKQAMDLLRQLPSYKLQHIPRALNGRADELSNQAMDRRRSSSSSSQGGD